MQPALAWQADRGILQASGPPGHYMFDRLWNLDDIVVLIDARAEPPKKRGPYKTRARQAAPESPENSK